MGNPIAPIVFPYVDRRDGLDLGPRGERDVEPFRSRRSLLRFEEEFLLQRLRDDVLACLAAEVVWSRVVVWELPMVLKGGGGAAMDLSGGEGKILRAEGSLLS